MAKLQNIIGERFGSLVIVSRAENDKYGNSTWIAVCDCGKKAPRPIAAHNLKGGRTRSCGCLKKVKRGPRGPQVRTVRKKTKEELELIKAAMDLKYPKIKGGADPVESLEMLRTQGNDSL
jgi:hypothetical protein